MVEKYIFGLITVNGETFNYDIETDWSGAVLPWQREDGHTIGIEDVERAVAKNPESIVIGTGEKGFARVTEEAKLFIEGRGIQLVIDKTEEAVKTFNVLKDDSFEEEGRQNRVVGLFHLTC